MIRKQGILDRAAEWGLRPEVVEKDYVLGWLLAAIASSDVGTLWILKGGTCIKKCFLETYRFSEDLDFSLLPEAPYSVEAIGAALHEILPGLHERSGIEFPLDLVDVRPRRNKQGQETFQARIAYNGPLAIPGYPRVLLDITQNEPVFDPPDARAVLHPYPDELPRDSRVLTYTFAELLAEKTRALYERARPRDLYDVVYLLENAADAFDSANVQALFRRKCQVKQLTAPSVSEVMQLVRDAEELRSEWRNMLGHQLPMLPSLDSLITRLPRLLTWIDLPAAVMPDAALATPSRAEGEVVVAPQGIRSWGTGLRLETIRFAGSNRLMIEFDYNSRHRIAEPYSLRRAETTGNLLLYAWEDGATHIKAFIVGKMSGIRVTNQGFTPRYRIEFTATGPALVPRTSTSAGVRGSRRPDARRARSRKPGRTYLFRCPYCQKTFKRCKNDSKLRKHKTKDGFACPGRTGYLLRVQ